MASTSEGVLSGAGQGAATGAMFGPWGAVIGAGVGAVSGWLGSKSAKKGAEQQRQAAEQAKQIQTQQYQQALGYQQPYMNLGRQGADQLGMRMNDLTRNFTADDFTADPGYDFRLGEGTKAMQGGAAARGGVLSGAAQKALAQYGQNFASNEYNNAYNRFTGQQDRAFNKLFGVAGMGQNAANNASTLATGYGNSMAGLLTGQGNAAAAGTIGSSNALTSGLNQAYNAYQDNALLRALQGGQFAGGNLPARGGSNQLFQRSYGFGGDMN